MIIIIIIIIIKKIIKYNVQLKIYKVKLLCGGTRVTQNHFSCFQIQIARGVKFL